MWRGGLAHIPAVGRLWDKADVVVAVGSDFDGMNTQNWTMPPPASLIAINIDPVDAEKNYRPKITLVGDSSATVERLTEALTQRPGITELEGQLHTVRADGCRSLDGRALRFLDALSFGLPPDAQVLCDMCIPGYWTAGFYDFTQPRKLQYPVGWGTLGFAFPAGLGAALCDDQPTVAICGDGGFLFACGELATVAQERIPLTTVIVDDGGYGMLRYDQQQAGTEPFGVDLKTPDFVALAQSFGLYAESVAGIAESFGEALARHCAEPTPSVLVAKADPLIPPPTTSPQWYRRKSSH